MGKKLYVGNLPYDTGDSKLQELFEEYGSVQSAQVIMDRETGRSKGFGFVEMGSDDEARRDQRDERQRDRWASPYRERSPSP